MSKFKFWNNGTQKMEYSSDEEWISRFRGPRKNPYIFIGQEFDTRTHDIPIAVSGFYFAEERV